MTGPRPTSPPSAATWRRAPTAAAPRWTTRTGELIRHLPSITPPPEFREAVFAAIPREERRLAPEVASALARRDKSRELPVIRLAPRPPRPTRVRLAPRVASVAAVLLLSFVTAKLLPRSIPPRSTARRRASRAARNPRSLAIRWTRATAPSPARSTDAWLVYSAADASRARCSSRATAIAVCRAAPCYSLV